jgi:hypothetical protein
MTPRALTAAIVVAVVVVAVVALTLRYFLLNI